MIARIQTLYLFLAALLAAGSMALPFWSVTAEQQFLFSDFSLYTGAGALFVTGSYAAGIFSPLTALAAIAAIFLYKNRQIQRSFITLGILLFLGDLLSGLTAAHFMNQHFQALAPEVTHRPEAGFFILLPEPVLFWLAMKGVVKDEKIANAYKRL
ncbi:MAG: DUF4293 family protein [Chlorobium sp.]|nr:DUF4293 family protein [Chlorobium phaeovibrioides]NQU45653.1 DUF4293 family protein [Chlorobium sp.]